MVVREEPNDGELPPKEDGGEYLGVVEIGEDPDGAMKGAPPSEGAIKEAVLEILQEADLESTTESKVRKLASEKLGADLNAAAHKKLVRRVVEDYLSSRAEAVGKPTSTGVATEEEEEEAPAADDGRDDLNISDHEKESDDGGDAQPSKFSRRQTPAPKQRRQTTGDDDDRLICQLSNKRNVSIQKFKGKTLVSIREYYEKDGELRPSAKGISLTVDQWQVLKSNVSAIEKAIAKLE